MQVLARRHFSAHPLAHDKTCQDTTRFCNSLITFEYLEFGLTWARPDSLPLRARFDWNNHTSKQLQLDKLKFGESRNLC